MIEIQAVSKRFFATLALDDVSVNIEKGKIYGLLGRNGAGKTTLLNLITGRLLSDSGTITLEQMPLPEHSEPLSKVFMIGEATLFPPEMKVKETFRWMSHFYPQFDRARADAMAAEFSLNLRQKNSKLSTGYKTIYKLILALCSGAEYILLDEPVLGLDANHRVLFYRYMVETYAEQNCTIVVSTHLVEEISSYVEDVIIIDQGKLLLNQSVESLLSDYHIATGKAADMDGYLSEKDVLSVTRLSGLTTACLRGEAPQGLVPGIEFSGIDLQSLFVSLTNEGGARV